MLKFWTNPWHTCIYINWCCNVNKPYSGVLASGGGNLRTWIHKYLLGANLELHFSLRVSPSLLPTPVAMAPLRCTIDSVQVPPIPGHVCFCGCQNSQWSQQEWHSKSCTAWTSGQLKPLRSSINRSMRNGGLHWGHLGTTLAWKKHPGSLKWAIGPCPP